MSRPLVKPMARLECDHYVRITTSMAQQFDWCVCPTCQAWSRPRVVLIREWRVWCETAGCSWERWVGQTRGDADKVKHLHHKGGRYDHVVRIAYAMVPGMEYTQRINPQRGSLSAYSTEEIPNEPVQPHLF